MVYQEMLCLPNLSVSANISAAARSAGSGASMKRRCVAARKSVLDRLSLRIDPDALPNRSRPPSAVAPGGACAGVRLPHPRARRADDGADRRGSRSPVRCLARVEEGGNDDLCTSRIGCRKFPALRSHHGPARRSVRRHVHDRAGIHQRHRQAMVGQEILPKRSDKRLRPTSANSSCRSSALAIAHFATSA
jgi:hypothetical protein